VVLQCRAAPKTQLLKQELLVPVSAQEPEEKPFQGTTLELKDKAVRSREMMVW